MPQLLLRNEMLKYLVKSEGIDWSRVVAFHLDEYIGLQSDSNQLFSEFLKRKLFRHVQFKEIYLIDGNNTVDECEKYGRLISELPIDIVCMGIGENGHLAFNDPMVANFNDPEIMKKVELDSVCRQQQVNDGCFDKIEDVPQYAYTLSIPAIINGDHLFCMVPGKKKQKAVYHTLYAPEITTDWPSTILRNHPACRFYLDSDSYSEL